MLKHPNLLRFELTPVKRRLNQHWREKYGEMILRGQEKERRAGEEAELSAQRDGQLASPQANR